MRTPAEHYDRISAVLARLHAAYPASVLVNDIHAALGDAWDDYRAAHGEADPDLAARSGGGDKPPTDPNDPGGG